MNPVTFLNENPRSLKLNVNDVLMIRNRTNISEIHMARSEKRGSRSDVRGNRNTESESQDQYRTGSRRTEPVNERGVDD